MSIASQSRRYYVRFRASACRRILQRNRSASKSDLRGKFTDLFLQVACTSRSGAAVSPAHTWWPLTTGTRPHVKCMPPILASAMFTRFFEPTLAQGSPDLEHRQTLRPSLLPSSRRCMLIFGFYPRRASHTPFSTHAPKGQTTHAHSPSCIS